MAVDQRGQGGYLEQIYSRQREAHCGLDLSLGVRRMRRTDLQRVVMVLFTVATPAVDLPFAAISDRIAKNIA